MPKGSTGPWRRAGRATRTAARPGDPGYIIAVGGAGSSARARLRERTARHVDEQEEHHRDREPAGDRGEAGHLREGDLDARVARGLPGLEGHDGRREQAHERLAGDEARGGEDARVLDPRLLRLVVLALRRLLVHEAADEAADEDREGRLERQVHPDREEHRALHLHQDEREAHRDADDHERPGHLAAHDALRDRGHEARLRGRRAPARRSRRWSGCWRGRRCAAGRAGRRGRGRRPRRR